jgi:tRNA threonylcarbamoyl adenosine modification protein YeaZ
MYLGIDTSADWGGAALAYEGQVIDSEPLTAESSADDLVAALKRLTARSKSSLNQLKGIGVCLGPGSFTGLRSGIAAVQGLSKGSGVQVIGLSIFYAAQLAFQRSGLIKHRQANLLLRANDKEFFSVAFGWSSDGVFEWAGPIVTVLSLPESGLPELGVTKLGVPESQTVAVLPGNDVQQIELDGYYRDSSTERAPFKDVACAAELLFNSRPDALLHEHVQRLESQHYALLPIYGKGVNARTLADRGLERRPA